MTSRLPRLLTRLTGTPRLVLAALLLVAGAVSALAAGAPPATVTVVVAVRDVAAGQLVSASDVRATPRPRDQVPTAAVHAVAALTGHRASARVAAGEVLTADRVVGDTFASDLATGRSVAAVSVSTAAAGISHPGDVVDVVRARSPDPSDPAGSSDPGADADSGTRSVEVLAHGARVLAVWPVEDGRSGTAALVLDVAQSDAAVLSVLSSEVLVGIVRTGR